MIFARRAALSLVFLFSLLQASAQNTFTMRDTTVRVCSGTLYDSNANLVAPGNYANNENFVFTICPDTNVGTLSLIFAMFNVEAPFDYIKIYAGQDTFAPLIGGPFNNTNLPPINMNFSSCITIYFHSDASVTGPGWTINWTAHLDPPIPPIMTVIPQPQCSTASVNVTFSHKIHCDSIYSSNFVFTGPVTPSVTAVPIGCVNDSTTQVQLNLNPPLNLGGQYQLNFSYNFLDACDSLWHLQTQDTFVITNCPLSVIVDANPDTICPGQCVTLLATGTGGDPFSWLFTWNNGLSNGPGPKTVCPMVTTTYTVTLDDASAAPPASASVTVHVKNKPNAQNNVTVCETDPAFNLTANPPGGTWSGPGITNAALGTFNPDTANAGNHSVVYTAPNGCTDTVVVSVNPVDAGPTQAACPGAAPFMMTGFTPPGGSWSGPNITVGGQFNPSVGGVYTVTYTFGSCTDTKQVFVQNIVMPPNDTVCASLAAFNLSATPPGGSWSGPGITNASTGRFNPPSAAVGNNTLTYTINGCNATMVIRVEAINANADQVVCPKQNPFIILPGSPGGGVWSGPGLLDTLTGLFDPGINPYSWNALLTYTQGSCSDQKYVYVRNTYIPNDTMLFCRQTSTPVQLNAALTGRDPWNGIWTGPGITASSANGPFVPSLAGPGYHVLYYTANTCSDSMIAWVLPPKTLTDTIVCELANPFWLQATPADPSPGGVWAGPGITDPHGRFDPSAAGVGTHTIIYTNWIGCNDTTTLQVVPEDSVDLSGLSTGYCYSSNPDTLVGYPSGGTFSGDGMTDSIFVPTLAGPGVHAISYTYGAGDCQQTVTKYTQVGQPLNLVFTVTDDSICPGAYVTLSALAAGGTGSGYSFSWNNGLPPSFQHLVQPPASTTYIVTANDGCSDPVSDTLSVFIYPSFSLSFDTSAMLCYHDNGWAKVLVNPPGNYSYIWNLTPPQNGDSISGAAGNSYSVTVTDSLSGCAAGGSILIPSWPRVIARFISNPADCATISDPQFAFIDQSGGCSQGTWNFGDGATQPWMSAVNPSHIYTEVGTYTVYLDVSNAGGCSASYSLDVCVDPVPLHVFNTFTPNGDGDNDFLEIDGLEKYPDHRIQIFNRYGNLVYEAAPYNNDWNGTHYKTGVPLPDGAYFYVIQTGEDGKDIAGDVVIFR